MFHPPTTKRGRCLPLIRRGVPIEAIMAEVGCTEATVRLAASLKGLTARRGPKAGHKAFAGTVKVQHRGHKRISANGRVYQSSTFVPLPASALRAAGLDTLDRLSFHVSGDQITVSRLHENPDCGKL